MGCNVINKTIDLLKLHNEINKQISADVLLQKHLDANQIEFNRIISLGKAANEMAKKAVAKYNNAETLIICPENSFDYNLKNCTRIIGNHPIVNDKSIEAGDILYNFIKDNTKESILFLISGGGSAIVEKLDRIPLNKYQECISHLMNNGADINELNTIRKHLSMIKGGNLLNIINKDSYGFILCDIMDNQYQNVASGIIFRDDTNIIDAKKVLNKYGLNEYEEHLHETPKNVQSLEKTIIGSNEILLEIIKQNLEQQDVETIISDYRLKEEAPITGLNIGCQIFKYHNTKRSFAVVYGGESVVNVKYDGIGGRVLETALAISIEIQGLKGVQVLASATDGKDGNAPASGVIIDGDTYTKMVKLGKNPLRYLKKNDSYNALKDCAEIIPQKESTSNLNDYIVVYYT